MACVSAEPVGGGKAGSAWEGGCGVSLSSYDGGAGLGGSRGDWSKIRKEQTS